MKVLSFTNSTQTGVAKAMFPEAEIVSVAPGDVIEVNDEQYDIVLLYHILQTLPRNEVGDFVNGAAALVKQGGELWMFAPSAEWAIRRLAKDQGNLLGMAVLFGEDIVHRCPITIELMRALVEEVGLICRVAQQTTYTIGNEENRYDVPQNYVVGYKR